MSETRNRATGLALALVSAACFGTSGTFARSLIDAGWTPAAAAAVRIGIAALVLALPALVALRGRFHTLRANAAPLVLYGIVAVAGAQVCYFHAVRHLSVGVALLLEYLGTLLVVGWLWMRHGERPRRLTAAGSAVAVLGLALVLDVAGGGALSPIGVMWGLAAALGLAAFFVLSARLAREVPPVAIAGLGMAVGTVALVLLGALGVLPLRATFGAVTFAGRSVSWLVPVAGLSLVAAVVAYVAGVTAARLLGAKLSSFLGLTEVVFAVLFAWLLLGELPTGVQLLGGLLIVAGVVFVHVDELRPPEPPAASAPEVAALLA